MCSGSKFSHCCCFRLFDISSARPFHQHRQTWRKLKYKLNQAGSSSDHSHLIWALIKLLFEHIMNECVELVLFHLSRFNFSNAYALVWHNNFNFRGKSGNWGNIHFFWTIPNSMSDLRFALNKMKWNKRCSKKSIIKVSRLLAQFPSCWVRCSFSCLARS